MLGVKYFIGFGIVDYLAAAGDNVGYSHSRGCIEKPPHLFKIGICDFCAVFRKFYLRYYFVVLFNCHKLVDAAENWLGLGGYHSLPHAEAVNLCALHKDIADNVFVQRIGRDYLHLGKALVVQHLSCAFGKVSYIAAVNAYSRGLFAPCAHFLKHSYSVGNARFKHIVGVHQKSRAVGVALCVSPESFKLAVKHLYPRVSHSAKSSNSHFLVGNGAGGTAAARDVGRSRAVNRPVAALSTTGAELHNGSALGGADYPVCLCGNKALVIYADEHHSLHKLRLYSGPADGDHGLSGENRRTLRYRPYIAAEAEVFQVLKKSLAENALCPQVLYIVVVKAETVHIVYHLVKAAHYGKAPVVGNASEKHIKVGDHFPHTVLKVAVRHCQLVKIGKHCKISCSFIHSNHVLIEYHFISETNFMPLSFIIL